VVFVQTEKGFDVTGIFKMDAAANAIVWNVRVSNAKVSNVRASNVRVVAPRRFTVVLRLARAGQGAHREQAWL
jgi:hypothetical protein